MITVREEFNVACPPPRIENHVIFFLFPFQSLFFTSQTQCCIRTHLCMSACVWAGSLSISPLGYLAFLLSTSFLLLRLLNTWADTVCRHTIATFCICIGVYEYWMFNCLWILLKRLLCSLYLSSSLYVRFRLCLTSLSYQYCIDCCLLVDFQSKWFLASFRFYSHIHLARLFVWIKV